ncbi:MAG: hypothetical protein ACRDS9_12790 [Pseudonocardiaceae bacterium]
MTLNQTPDLAGMGPSQPDHGLNGQAEQLPRTVHPYRGPRPEMSQLVVAETSADGTVRVSVDAHGMPTELTLTDRAYGVDPAQLSAELMSCLWQAHRTLAGRVSNSAAEDDDPSMSSLLC